MPHTNEQRFSVAAYSQSRKAGVCDRKQFRELAEEIRQLLVNLNDSDVLNRAVLGHAIERRHVMTMIHDALVKRRLQHLMPPESHFSNMAEAIFSELVGLSVLELILKESDGLEEIQVVGKRIYEVRDGVAKRSKYSFSSVTEVEKIQQNLVLYNHDTLSPNKRWAETTLSDGSRVAMTGFGFTSEPTITIRLYKVKNFNLDQLAQPAYATLNDQIASLLRCLVKAYFNIVIIGATNSGKSHLIKALIQEMTDDERLVTIETRFELMLKRDFPEKNIVEFEVDDSDVNHSSASAFKLALRQSPKRIIHTEIRDDDANIYVRACTRGHQGSMTTVHVNMLEDVPEAITDMCMLDRRGMNPERLTKRITEHVTQIGIEMAIIDGKRKIVRIGEFLFEAGQVKVRNLVTYNRIAKKWEFPASFSERSAHRILHACRRD